MKSAVGYSGTPLHRKLGIKAGMTLLVSNGPDDYSALVTGAPDDIRFVSRAGKSVDIAHVFVTRRADLKRRLTALRRALRPDAAIWVSWPKKSSKVPTDFSEDVIRAVALPMGLVDIKVCAVTEVWSGLKLVVRKELR